MNPARGFFASLSVSLLALTLSYQATMISASLTPAPKPPATDAWIDHAEAVPYKGKAHDDMSQLAPLL
jgi:hypothetical protein